MKALAKLALTLCLTLSPLLGFGQTQTISTAPPDFSRAELDQMLAPIALYPDTVLSHVLIASTYPLEVVQADRWARANSRLDAQAAVNAVEDQDWDPSVKALVAFPELLQRMSDDLDWTQRVGDAFLADEGEVMGVIQDLRQKAYASGSLDKLEYVRVQREKKIIYIEPAVERVVYVPYYDPRVVYGGWWWPEYPPVYWHHPHHHIVVGGFYWGPRVYVAPSFYFSSFHWHNRRVVVVDYHRHHHHPRFYSGRGIARYDGARHWRHNPHHRRGVVYRNDHVRHHYGSQRVSHRSLQEQRRPDRNLSSREQPRQGNLHGQRNNREQDHAGVRPNARRDGQVGVDQRRNSTQGTDGPRQIVQRQGSDAERVRERLSNRESQHQRPHTSNNTLNRNDTRPNQARQNNVERIQQGRETNSNSNRQGTARIETNRPNSIQRAETQPRRNEAEIRRNIQPSAQPQTGNGNNRAPVIRQHESRPRQEHRRAEQVQATPRHNEVNARRAEPARQQVHRPDTGGNNARRGEGSSGGRESRRIER